MRTNHGRPDYSRIYLQLKDAIGRRAEDERLQREAWAWVRRTGRDGTSRLDAIDRRIGESTHRVNLLVGELCTYRGRDKAMNLAAGYLRTEIERTKRIVAKWQGTVARVDRGEWALLSSRGYSHHDTTNSKAYLAKKQRYLEKLRKWLAYVEAHLA